MASPNTLISTYGDYPVEQRGSFKQDVTNRVMNAISQEAPEAGEPSPFYPVLGSQQAANPEVARMSQMVSQLVDKGFIDSHDAQKLEFRVLSAQEPLSSDAIKTEQALLAKQGPSAEPSDSHFNREHQSITVQEKQIPHFDMSAKEGSQTIFLHELGHGIQNAEDVPKLLSEVAAHKDPASPESQLLNANTGVLGKEHLADNIRWGVLAGEMYADCFEVAATAQLQGREAALQNLDKVAATRTMDARDFTNRASKELAQNEGIAKIKAAQYLENHHTSKALDVMRDKLQNGELDHINSSEQRNHIIADAVAKGFVEEYQQVRMAELNVYHDKDGKLAQGLPEGVSTTAFLAAEIQNPQDPRLSGAKVVSVAEQAAIADPDKPEPLGVKGPEGVVQLDVKTLSHAHKEGLPSGAETLAASFTESAKALNARVDAHEQAAEKSSSSQQEAAHAEMSH